MRTASTATRLAAALAVALLLAAGEGSASAVRDAPNPPDHAPKCIQELAGVNDIIKGCLVDNMFGDSSAMNLDAKFLAKDQMLKAVNHLPSKVKQAIFDCFANHKVIVGEDGNSGNWCIEYIELLVRSNAVFRRTLAEHTMQIMSSHFASASPTATAVFQSLAPSQFPSPDPPEATKSVPIDTTVPTKNDKLNHSERTDTRHQSQTGSNASRAPSRNGTAHDKDDTMPVTVAVIITGLVSFVLAACAFLFFDKFCRKSNHSDSFRKDEKPLLTLSLSDFSADSSRKLYGLGGASYNDNNGTLSFKSDPGLKKNLTFSEVHPSEIPPSVVTLGISNSPAVEHSSQSTPTPVPSAVSAPPPVVPPPPPPAQKAPPSGPPPPPLPNAGGPRPPPPPKGGAPRPPPSGAGPRKAPPGPNRSAGAASDEDNSSKTKLKPFFWDKVLANPDQSMVWHQISSGSFQFNEEMIESLFGCTVVDKQKGNAKKGSAAGGGTVQQVQILDPKKSQNLAILLRALNVTTQEVLEALMEGNELPSELLQTLLKMAPTSEEEFKLRLYSGDLSLLGPAERFLKALVDIPFAFKRLDALLYMGSLHEDMSSVKESFVTVETACTELRSSRLFLKILEAVLKTGNRMNDGTYRGGAQAFKLDTLLKLSDVKGTDGKITLLHFVVQEIIRSEGMKAARIARESGSFSGFSFKSQDLVIDDSPVEAGDHIRSLGLNVVSGLGNELENVKKAAALDADTLTTTVAILGHGLVKMKEFLNKDMKSIEEDSEFHRSLDCFVEHAEKDITSLLEEEKRIRLLVKNTSDYFHGNAAKDEGLRLFVIVRDFLGMIDKVCHEIKQAPPKKVQKPPPNNVKEGNTSQPVPDPRRLLFPAIAERRADSSDSDYDSP